MSRLFGSILAALAISLSAAGAGADTVRGKYGVRQIEEKIEGFVANRVLTDQRGSGNGLSIFQNGRANTGAVVQDGNQNVGTIQQNGDGNTGAIRQVGRGNSAGIVQTGDNNAACVLQIGKRLDTEIVQSGGQSTGIIQTKKGTREFPGELCYLADGSLGRMRQLARYSR